MESPAGRCVHVLLSAGAEGTLLTGVLVVGFPQAYENIRTMGFPGKRIEQRNVKVIDEDALFVWKRSGRSVPP